MLGSNSDSPKIYLSVGFGKIRQKALENKARVDASTPNAVKRITQSGGESWALEHDFVSGVIEKIFFKEDTQYGNSFEVVINDVVDTYQLSFPEDSRFWFDFAKKLPNIKLAQEVKITAYDFTDKTNKHRAGISVEQNGAKIPSFYDEKLEGGGWKLLHGFPSGEGVDFYDKDELKIYFIKVKKFLRNEFKERFEGYGSDKPENNSQMPENDAPLHLAANIPPEPEYEEGDAFNDLPF